jgi:hypothetical protein
MAATAPFLGRTRREPVRGNANEAALEALG